MPIKIVILRKGVKCLNPISYQLLIHTTFFIVGLSIVIYTYFVNGKKKGSEKRTEKGFRMAGG